MTFKEATEEFLPIAKEIFEKHKEDLGLTVDPSLVMFLRTDSRRKAFAYCKIVREEYELLTDKKFFIVMVNKYFDRLKTEGEKKFVILHEMKHLDVTDKEKYRLLDHNLKEFHELLQNPTWNLELVKDKTPEIIDTDSKEVKIGLDFDFKNTEAVREFKKKVKDEMKDKENK